MKITRIEMLYLIWALPVLFLVFFHGMRRRRRILRKFASGRGLATIALSDAKLRWIKAALILTALLWAAAALSGPRYGYRWRQITPKGIDIIVALDCSKSMLTRDVAPSRLERAKREVYDLLALLRGDRIGLVAFAGTAFLQCPLTLDYGAFHLFLETLAPDALPVGGSDIRAAVSTAIAGFDAKGSREKAVILMTDGESTTDGGDPLAAADDAKHAGVRLFCIGIGTGAGMPVPGPDGGFMKDADGKIVVSRLSENLLAQAAAATGGAYVRSVAGDMDLDLIYTRKIRGGMQMETLAGGRKQVWEDRYQWALFLAAAALIVEMCLPSVTKANRSAGPMHPTLLMVSALALTVMTTAGPVYADAFRDGVEAYGATSYETALKHFIDAQLDAPDDPKIFYNLGSTYYRMGDFVSAARNFESAAAAKDPSIRRDALYNLGNAHFRKKDFGQAVTDYEAALKMAPDDREISENLALAKKMKDLQQERQRSQNVQGAGKNGAKASSSDGNETGSPSASASGRNSSMPEQNASDQNPSGQNPSGQRASGQDPLSAGRQHPPGSPETAKRFEADTERGRHNDPQPESKERPGQNDAADDSQSHAATSGSSDNAETGVAVQETNVATGTAGSRQTEIMLNRLKDQPGRALMPDYRKRPVDRDW